jgi:hypothetical protein
MKKTTIIIVFIVITVLTIVGVFYSLSRKETAFSRQQKELVKNLGYPTSYVIVFGEMVVDGEYKDVRFESWNYDRHGRVFHFVDKEFKKDSDIGFIDNADPFPIKPNKFKKGLTFEEFKKIVKAEPSVSGEVPDYIMENTIVYDFADQMKVGVENDIVVYIEALPIELIK